MVVMLVWPMALLVLVLVWWWQLLGVGSDDGDDGGIGGVPAVATVVLCWYGCYRRLEHRYCSW